MNITAYNPSTDNLEKSYLSKNYAIGTTSFTVRNNNKFNANDRIMIGEMGNENTEILTLNSVNSDGITIVTSAGCKYPHTASDPVYVLKYDQVKFYRSTSGIDGTYNDLVTVALDVDNEDLKTRYDDTTGLSAYYYKVSYYASIAIVETSLSDPIPGSGYEKKQVGTLVTEFLTEIGDMQQEYITVPQIFGLLNECNEDIIGQSRRPYRFLRKKVPATLTLDTPTVSLEDVAPDLIRLDRVKYTRTDLSGQVVKGNLVMISNEEMEYKQYNTNALTPAAINPGVFEASIDETDNTIVINPTPTTTQTDALMIYYWGDFDYITSLADTFQTPVKRIYKLFLLSRFYRMRAKKDSNFLALSDRYDNNYNTEIVKLQRAQKIDVGTKRSFLPDARTSHGLRRRV